MINTLCRIIYLVPFVLFPDLLSAQDVAPGDILVTEFMANPNAISDGAGEYVELYNKRSIALNIDGFILMDDGSNSHTIDNGGSLAIPAESFIVLAVSSTPGFTPDYVYSGFSLANSEDEIILARPDGTEISRVNYTSSQVSSGISAELNAIANVNSNGTIAAANFQSSSSAIGNGDSGSPGETGSTDLSESATVRFSNAGASVNEGDGAINIEVTIEDPDGTAVDVDVVFQQGPSSAEESDFSTSVTKSVSFSNTATDGDTQNASFTLQDDLTYEGKEKARFKLENITTSGGASLSGQTQYTLTIEDNEYPEVVINEIHADPDGANGDADGNGSVSTDDDEFIEIVNAGPVSIDIGGWTISDAAGVKHTFDSGTILPAKGAVVVFGGSTFAGHFGGSVVQGAGSLGLNNGGDTVTLKDASGNTIDEHVYASEGGENQALVRAPDITGVFVKHSDATGSGGALFSPGTQIDGSLFTTAIFIEGNSGWRMLAPPSEKMAISEISDDTPIQGFGDGFDKNFFTGYDGSSFTAPPDLSGTLNSGEGFLLYFFNNSAASSSTLPVVIDTGSGSEPAGDVTVPLHASGDGWNLLGNPFQTAFDMNALMENGGSLANSVGSVWSDEDESYTLTTLNENKIAPGQGFFIQNDTASAGTPATSVTFPVSGKTTGTRFFKSPVPKGRYIQFVLHSRESGTGKKHKDLSTVLYFHEDAKHGLDRWDTGKLYPLKSSYSILGIMTKKGGMRAQDARPVEFSDTQTYHLDMEAVNVKSTHKITWELANIPESWEIVLNDKITGSEINLREQASYIFSVPGNKISITNSSHLVHQNFGPVKRKTTGNSSRFKVQVIPETAVSIHEPENLPKDYVLEQNYPNPFNPSTVIRYQLPEAGKVRLEVFDVLGRQVATLADSENKPAGIHSVIFDAAGLSSGIYLYRLTAGNTTKTRTLTLIK